MAEIIIICAVAKNNGIGKDNKIPWYIKEDFQHFKTQTMGSPIIMGDKTYESLPKKPLPGRENIVLTFDKDYKPEGTTVFNSFEDAIEYVKDKEKAYICGGATIYKIAMDYADTLDITHVDIEPDADTFFPKIDPEVWQKVSEEPHEGYTFTLYKRKK
jgi:dihydrofolate reductase